MQKTKWLVVLGSVAALVTGMVWLAADSGDKPETAAEPASQAAVTGAVSNAGQTTANIGGRDVNKDTFAAFVERGLRLGALPGSLKGTEVDGHLRADTQGNLLLDAGIRQMFDYYLSVVGEEDLQDIKARIALYISRQDLPAAAKDQAWALLGHYLDYRQAMGSMQVPGNGASVADLAQVVATRRQVRETWLGEAASQAFFGPEQAYDDYTLARMKVEEDQSLSDAAKQARIVQLQSELPQEVQDVLQQAVQPVEAAQQVDAMRAQGASDADIQAWRTDRFGAEAAERLQALDSERVAWQGRYDDYQQQRQEIEQAGLSAKDKDAQITALRNRLFAPEEQKRVSALDDIAARSSSEVAR